MTFADPSQTTATIVAAARATPAQVRDIRLDFFRGIAMFIILMAHTLGLEVVAEGVETPEQHRFLCKGGCDHLQGFFYARPMPAEEMTRLLEDGQLEINHTCLKH